MIDVVYNNKSNLNGYKLDKTYCVKDFIQEIIFYNPEPYISVDIKSNNILKHILFKNGKIIEGYIDKYMNGLEIKKIQINGKFNDLNYIVIC